MNDLVKAASTVLRRGESSIASSLSDKGVYDFSKMLYTNYSQSPTKQMEKKEIKTKLQELECQVNKKPLKIKQGKKSLPAIIISELFAGIFIGVVLGYYTDKYMNTLPVFLSLFGILGFFAALLNIYRNVYKN